jgi:hypothetical protein
MIHNFSIAASPSNGVAQTPHTPAPVAANERISSIEATV